MKNFDFNKFAKSTLTGVRGGYKVEKGAVFNKEKLEKNREKVERICAYWSAYPDLYVDTVLKPKESNFSLYFYQRIFLRSCLRYRHVYTTAPRAFSKTFISIFSYYLSCIFRPGVRISIIAPKKEQSAGIAKQKINEILTIYPLLRKELLNGRFNSGKDYVECTFRNGSTLDVVGALDSTRGLRKHSILGDELRDHDGQVINEVVLP